jgi:histidyl-tRNA synthetase
MCHHPGLQLVSIVLWFHWAMQRERKNVLRTETDIMGRNIGAQITHASKSAQFVAIIGKREQESGTVTLKDLVSGEQRELDLISAVREVVTSGPRG